MWRWVIIGLLYLIGMGFFRQLGGIRAAGETFQRWGKAASTLRNRGSRGS